MRLGCFIFLFCFTANSFSQHNYLLQGTIGRYPVVMSIRYNSDSDIAARYFYKSSLKDIFLYAEIDEETKQFIITDEYFDDSSKQDVFTEKFSLTTSDYKTFKGTWTNNKKKLDVSLNVVDTTQISTKNYTYYNEGFDKFYSILRIQNVKLSKDSVTVKNKLTLQWFSDKESKINMFRVANGIADYTKLKKINKALENYQYQSLYEFYECANNDRKRGEYNYWISNVFIANNFISIDGSVFNDCGGMHPNSNDNNLTINLKTGNVIEKITDVFNLYDDKFDDDDSLNEYSRNYKTGNCILNILKKMYSQKIQKETQESSNCNYYEIEQWEYADFLFRYDGVYFNPSFPHALQSCRYTEWSVIPYSILKKYLKKESQFVL